MLSITKRWGRVNSFGHVKKVSRVLVHLHWNRDSCSSAELWKTSSALQIWRETQKWWCQSAVYSRFGEEMSQSRLDFAKLTPCLPNITLCTVVLVQSWKSSLCAHFYSIELRVLFEGFSQRSVGWWVSWLMTATSLMSLPHPQDNPALHDFYLAEYQDF